MVQWFINIDVVLHFLMNILGMDHQTQNNSFECLSFFYYYYYSVLLYVGFLFVNGEYM